MMSNQPDLIPIETFDLNFQINGALGPAAAGGGGLPDEGVYRVKITEINGMRGDGNRGPRVSLTLAGIGNRETYDSLPVPHGDKAEFHQRLWLQSFVAFGMLAADAIPSSTFSVTGQQVAGLRGREAWVYYIPPTVGADGRVIPRGTPGSAPQEITYLSESEKTAVETGDLKITRRRKVDTAAVLGISASAPAPAVGAPVMPGQPTGVLPGQPAMAAAPLASPSAPSNGAASPLGAGLANVLGAGAAPSPFPAA